jgi:hypothetical protein
VVQSILYEDATDIFTAASRQLTRLETLVSDDIDGLTEARNHGSNGGNDDLSRYSLGKLKVRRSGAQPWIPNHQYVDTPTTTRDKNSPFDTVPSKGVRRNVRAVFGAKKCPSRIQALFEEK